jgi:hypothetical protein
LDLKDHITIYININIIIIIITKVAVKIIGNIAGASTKLTIFWGFEPPIGFNSL